MLDLGYMFIFWSKMTKIALSLTHIFTTGGARGLPWLNIEQWAFLYYQHNCELSTVNVDSLGSPRTSWRGPSSNVK